MSDQTKEKTYPGKGENSDEVVSHPLDRWVQRELRALYGDPLSEPLPPDIAELATKLEEKLKRPGGRGKKSDGD